MEAVEYETYIEVEKIEVFRLSQLSLKLSSGCLVRTRLVLVRTQARVSCIHPFVQPFRSREPKISLFASIHVSKFSQIKNPPCVLFASSKGKNFIQTLHGTHP